MRTLRPLREALSARSFDCLPPAITKSDADGQFTVRTKGKIWLLARSSRKVGSDDETYLWAVPTEGQSPKLLLSNDNQFNDPDSFRTFLQQIPGGFEPVAKAEAEAKEAAEERAVAAAKLAEERAAAERARMAAQAKLAEERAGEGQAQASFDLAIRYITENGVRKHYP